MPKYNAYNKGPWRHTVCGNKWSARLVTKYFSGTFEFDTFVDAMDYLFTQSLSESRATGNIDPYRSGVTGPGGFMTMSDDLARFF